MDATSSSLAGSLSFSPLQVGSGSNFGSSSGGLHFDIPLASLQAFQNQAFAFTSQTAHIDLGFLKGVTDRATATVDAASSRSAGLNLTAINAGWAIGAGNLNLADTISARATQVANNNIATQASVARYLSDNAARTAQYSVQQTTQQVQTQQKQSTVRKIFSSLTGGIFG